MTSPTPTTGMDYFGIDETAGFGQIRDWIGAHQGRDSDFTLIIPVPVSPALADDVKHVLGSPGFRFTDPDRVELVGHHGTATIRVTLTIAGGAR
ncbi:hypothetical protein ABZ502_17730 [Streptomyces abikoensis]|uniref:hypothetical protein n=1 Tax=Streptomyces abikoensis TaxID=97398 RepID=UPI0033C4DA80